MIKKILKWALLAFVAFVVIGVLLDYEDESSESTLVSEAVQDSEKNSKSDLSVSDFKLNKSISTAKKMLKSKGWYPGDGEEGECGSYYSGFLLGYGYEKQGGVFEGYRVPIVIISEDEYGKLAHFRTEIYFKVQADDKKQIKKILEEVEQNCILKNGFSHSSDEDDDLHGVLGYKNKNGDVCKMDINFPKSFDSEQEIQFELDYVSARFRKEELAAQEILRMSGRYAP